MTFNSITERNKFIEDNLSLVPYTLRKYNLPINDNTLQEGYLSLIKIVDRFDESKGCKFSTFAINSIRFYIQRYITVLLPVIKPTRKMKADDNGNWYDFADVLNFSSVAVHNTDNDDNSIELEQLISSNTEVSMEDCVISEIFVNEFLNSLSVRDREIVFLYGQWKTQKEIANILNISQCSVSRSLKDTYEKYMKYVKENEE